MEAQCERLDAVTLGHRNSESRILRKTRKTEQFPGGLESVRISLFAESLYETERILAPKKP